MLSFLDAHAEILELLYSLGNTAFADVHRRCKKLLGLLDGSFIDPA